jgi:hypothetical protein
MPNKQETVCRIPLPNSQPRSKNSAAGQLGKIEFKYLIENSFSTLKGCFLERRKRFSLLAEEISKAIDPMPPSSPLGILAIAEVCHHVVR